MAAAARIEAAGGHVIHMEVGQPAAPAPKVAIAAAHAALDDGADRLHIRARHSHAARADRETLPRYLRLCRRSRAHRDHDRLVRRIHSGVSVDVRAGRPGGGHGAGLSAIPAYPDGARLRAGADRDIERDASCADGRGLAGRASQGAAEGRAGRQPRQSDRNDDVARGAHRPDQCGGRRGHPLHFRRDLSWPRLCVSGGDGGRAFAACARDQLVLEIFLHDRLAGRLDGGAGAAGAADRTAAAEPRRSRCRRCRRSRPKRHSKAAKRWKRSSAAIRRTAAS